MKIGIIGAGQIGGTLTRRLTALGHEVSVANSRGPDTLADLAAETGANAVSVTEAARNADLVVVTIPEKNIPSLPRGLFARTADSLVVVDTGNYYPRDRDGLIEPIETGMTESRWVEQQLGWPVIKASTTSALNICWSSADLQAALGASPSRSRATTTRRRPWCCGSLTSSGSMALTRVGWTSRGGNSPAPPSTARTSTRTVCGAPCLRRATSARVSSGATASSPDTVAVPARPTHEQPVSWGQTPRKNMGGLTPFDAIAH
jgi:hypothetical protein